MDETPIRGILRRFTQDADFRRRAAQNMGGTLAEEGYILTDDEMSRMRNIWESLTGKSDRQIYERLNSLWRSGYR